MSHDAWTTEDPEQTQAIKQFLWDVKADGVINLMALAAGSRERYDIDFDKDGNNDVTVTINTDSYAMTIKRTANPSQEEFSLQRSPAQLAAYYDDPSGISYDPNSNGLAYYYKGIHFIVRDPIKVKDNLTIDLMKGDQTFNGAEAAAIKVMLEEMSDKGIIHGENYADHTQYWYDFDKNANNDITILNYGDSIVLSLVATSPDMWSA